jgi:hypothetical protein
MWSAWPAYLSSFRDVFGLDLPIYEKFKAYEDCAKYGGFRYVHEEFCIVSDFPEILEIDEQNRPHSEKGPSHKWSDGFEIYHLKGVRLEKEWWEKIVNDTMSPEEVFAINNLEHRRIAFEYMDKLKMKQLKDFKVLDEGIDEKGNPVKVISFNVQNMDEDLKFYNCICPTTKREYFLMTDQTEWKKAKDGLSGLEDVEWVNEW